MFTFISFDEERLITHSMFVLACLFKEIPHYFVIKLHLINIKVATLKRIPC